MDIRDLLQQKFLGNTLENFIWFAGIMSFGYIFKTMLSQLLSGILYGFVKSYSVDVTKADFRRLLVTPLAFLTFLIFLYLAFDRLHYPTEFFGLPEKGNLGFKTITQRIYRIFLILSITWVILRLVDFFGMIFMKRAEKTISKLDDQLVPFFKDFTKIILVLIGFFVILGTVFYVDVTKLITGLGVGGLALAFAAKESIENLLASFTIFLDQPFVVGDLVQVGEITGVVEKIGFRSTRIRTLEKSYVTLPNKHMIDKPLDNLTLRTFRRVLFDVSVTYKTTSEQVRAIAAEIQTFIDNHPHTNQDGRVRFNRLGSHSKDIMVQYFVDTMDWNEYINIKEEINYKIVEIVEKHQAEFALPTTSIVLQKTEQDKLNTTAK
ncbi:mechanosensitive ion channel family protein [Adhaeribacter radiodurans]|uniref:Mechanosensitive ion channel family protein n=1 Tax=Adhaeribacter radiodurans TaxID=2745197 RepID=A0A7L7L4I7_9BACT|nr:mechanosensitive ion channel family protein [Adhaeribacter radiodurans]QMU27722.1 mechanosensitive ion channel family protein [Adhaeribacter radiodurans]